jgi:trans-aconitate methyltransferase
VPLVIDRSITILDSACGAGFWTLDMANTYPNAKVISLDAFPSDERRSKAYYNAAMSSPNIVYKHGDLTSHLSLPSSYLDIIYQRDTASYMPSERWSFLFDV